MIDLVQPGRYGTISDISTELGLAPATLRVYRHRSTVPFPRAAGRVGGALVYRFEDVEAWRLADLRAGHTPTPADEPNTPPETTR